MFDEYLLRYILEYLKKCKRCNKYDVNNNGKLCCICGDFFCEDCKTNIINYYGFYKSKFCLYCNNFYFSKT